MFNLRIKHVWLKLNPNLFILDSNLLTLNQVRNKGGIFKLQTDQKPTEPTKFDW